MSEMKGTFSSTVLTLVSAMIMLIVVLVVWIFLKDMNSQDDFAYANQGSGENPY